MKTITLQKQILDRIKTQRVRPTPKGYFKARDYIVWSLLAIFLGALSVAFGMVIFAVHSTDRSLFAKLGLSFSEKLFYSIPIFWIIATIVVGILVYVNFRHTRRGYRVSTTQFAVIATGVAIALGSLVYVFNVSKYVDQAAEENIPLYSAIVPLNTNTWFDPDHGLLSGHIKEKTSDDEFTLRDKNFELWTVTGSNISVVPDGYKFQTGDNIKIIGKKTGNFTFTAIEIRPFEIQVTKEQRQENATTSQ